MLTTLLLTTAALTHIAPVCSWDRPGHNPFQGNVAEAVDHYKDIPRPIREALKQRIRLQQPDETVQIGRDRIIANGDYDPTISDMHFGPSSLCRSITRSAWRSDHVEPATVYCEQGECVIVPRICNNLSRIRRRDGQRPDLLSVAPPAAAATVGQPPVVDGGAAANAGPEAHDAPTATTVPVIITTLPGGNGSNALLMPVSTDWSASSGRCATDPGSCPAAAPVSAPVPEPATWAMWLSGLMLLVGATQRWRRSSQLK